MRLPTSISALCPHARTSQWRNSTDDLHNYCTSFKRKGSGVPSILPRALHLPIPIGIALLEHYGIIGDGGATTST